MKAYRYEYFETIGSTNDVIKERADNDEDEGLVVISNEQSAGRGRMGRTFFSPKGSGLYFSILLRPSFGAEAAALTTPAAAVAVCRGIEACGDVVHLPQKPMIKWVNDIYAAGGKVCGILTEAAADPAGGLKYLVLGIGINICPPAGGFPGNIKAAGLLPSAPSQELLSKIRERLLEAILRELRLIYESMEADPDDSSFLEYYRERNLVIGKRVEVVSGAAIAEGREEDLTYATAVGIDDRCRLMVRLADGSEKTLGTGEVRIEI